ncbi:unnamed protein product [Lepeophtheirus salmonis]|uniref:(salmon louse) hypothetical protein n=1 Tax=Lepeophtheirus salmonis TaxID=72036 RepID=A0A7R8H8R4_LEPSM|nr:unnamed protein product [Lepeophtheirus salmonis]CAF2946571.1 unnamed protein product [Lepeophtheirus salmonis]
MGMQTTLETPPIPPPRSKRRLLSSSYSEIPPAVPPHMHGNGIPIPLPKSPPTTPEASSCSNLFITNLQQHQHRVGARILSDQTSPGGTFRSSLRCVPPSLPPRRDFYSSTLPSSAYQSHHHQNLLTQQMSHGSRGLKAQSPMLLLFHHLLVILTTANTEGKGGSLHDLRSRDSKMDEARGHSRRHVSSSPKSSSPVVTPQVFDSSRNPCPPQQEPAPAIPQHHKKRFDKRTLTSLFLHHHGGGSGGDSSVHPPQNHHQSLLRRASITSFTSGNTPPPRIMERSLFLIPHIAPPPLESLLQTTTRRRRSIAITDDAYDNALRMAKSHLDLSLDTLSATSSPLIGKKNKLSLKGSILGRNNPLPSLFSSLSSSPAEVKKVKRNKAAGRSKTYPTRKSDEEFFTSPVFEKLKDENRVYSEDDILKDG